VRRFCGAETEGSGERSRSKSRRSQDAGVSGGKFSLGWPVETRCSDPLEDELYLVEIGRDNV
jgi:hypothetical protein